MDRSRAATSPLRDDVEFRPRHFEHRGGWSPQSASTVKDYQLSTILSKLTAGIKESVKAELQLEQAKKALQERQQAVKQTNSAGHNDAPTVANESLDELKQAASVVSFLTKSSKAQDDIVQASVEALQQQLSQYSLETHRAKQLLFEEQEKRKEQNLFLCEKLASVASLVDHMQDEAVSKQATSQEPNKVSNGSQTAVSITGPEDPFAPIHESISQIKQVIGEPAADDRNRDNVFAFGRLLEEHLRTRDDDLSAEFETIFERLHDLTEKLETHSREILNLSQSQQELGTELKAVKESDKSNVQNSKQSAVTGTINNPQVIDEAHMADPVAPVRLSQQQTEISSMNGAQSSDMSKNLSDRLIYVENYLGRHMTNFHIQIRDDVCRFVEQKYPLPHIGVAIRDLQSCYGGFILDLNKLKESVKELPERDRNWISFVENSLQDLRNKQQTNDDLLHKLGHSLSEMGSKMEEMGKRDQKLAKRSELEKRLELVERHIDTFGRMVKRLQADFEARK